jgi:hypothetical protein
MSKVIADMSMSLDGFVADRDDAVGPLFDWYAKGDTAFTFPGNTCRGWWTGSARS